MEMGRQAEAAPVLAPPGSVGWAVAVALCSLEGGFGLWLGCVLLGLQVALALHQECCRGVGLGGFSFCSAFSCLTD